MAPVVNKTLAVLATAGIVAVTYALYFDHKRRTDANFRKRLSTLNSCILQYVLFTTLSGREKKKLDKSTAQEAASSTAAGEAPLPTEEIHAAMALVKDDQVPTTPEEREKYFMSQVEKGELLCARGKLALLGCEGRLLILSRRARLRRRCCIGVLQGPSRLSLPR